MEWNEINYAAYASLRILPKFLEYDLIYIVFSPIKVTKVNKLLPTIWFPRYHVWLSGGQDYWGNIPFARFTTKKWPRTCEKTCLSSQQWALSKKDLDVSLNRMSSNKGKLVFGTNNVFSNENTCHIKLVIWQRIPITVYTNQNSHTWELSQCYIHYIDKKSPFHPLKSMVFVWLTTTFLGRSQLYPHVSPCIMKLSRKDGGDPIKSKKKSTSQKH